ncbi:acid protease [Thozetella sp. PMI_491]|nr:acid protease [Thozetella sp. PMI_491]
MATSFSSSSLLLLLGLGVGYASALNGFVNISDHEGCIHMPIIHSTNTNYFSKRAVEVQLANRSDVAYYAQLDIGSPAQSVFVQLDTGSFELWVNPDCTTVSGSDARFCQGVGQYDPSKSSSAQSLGTGKVLTYGIGSANITYFRDTIALPGTTDGLKNVQFGVATSSNDEFAGILGIGYGEGLATKYKNFIDELQAQNTTKVKAYTLALGSKDEQEGVIVFGGVDTSKFAGGLAKLPIIPAAQSPDQVPRYWVNMNSISLSPPSGKNKTYTGSNVPVFLDSGSTMTLLPSSLSSAIAADFGNARADANGFYQVDCSLTSVQGTLDFAFDGTTIHVPYKELVRVVGSGSSATCFLGISPSSSFTLLGDTFMRSAYTVFDLEGNNVWMTQAASCGSTPAALNTVDVLATLQGACGTSRSVTSPSSSSSTVASPGSSKTTTSSGTASTSGTATTTTGNAAARTAGSGSMLGWFMVCAALACML